MIGRSKPQYRQSRRVTANQIAAELPGYFVESTARCAFKSTADLNLGQLTFIRLSSYRIGDCADGDLNDAVRAVIDCAERVVFGLRFAGGRVLVFIGVPTGKKAQILAALRSSLDSLDCSVIDRAELCAEQLPEAGVLQGAFNGSFNWSPLCRQLIGSDCLVCFMAKRIPASSIYAHIAELDKLHSELTEYRYDAAGGSLQAKSERPNPRVTAALSCVDSFAKALRSAANDKNYHAALIYAAADACGAAHTAQALSAAFVPEGDGGDLSCERAVSSTVLDTSPFLFDELYMPCFRSVENGSVLPARLPLFCNTLSSIHPATRLSGLMPLPRDEFPGYYPVRAQRGADTYDEFDLKPHSSAPETGALIGTMQTGEPEYLDLRMLQQHMLLVGSSGSGKSTTIVKIAQAAQEHGIQMTVIEPIKGDFCELPSYGVGCAIYSSGHSGKTLCFNPFIPENLVSIFDHVKQMCIAITSATDNEAPIPQALQMLLLDVYACHGWAPDDIVFDDDRRTFPNFGEVYDRIAPYFKETKLYSGEVRTNVMSALTVRMKAIKDFVFVNGNKKLPVSDILGQNSVIQFDGLTHVEDKCFFCNILLTNINEYIRNQDESGSLKRLLIIDEAHNFFTRSGLFSDSKSSLTEVSRFFSNLLSEIRAYGVGVIVSDQRPSCLEPSVIANTAVKISHALENIEDIDVMSSAVGLSEYQKTLYHTLTPGEAIVSVRGNRNIVKCRVEKPQRSCFVIGMCRHCGRSGRGCVKKEASALLVGVPADYYAGVLRQGIADKSKLFAACDRLLGEAGVGRGAVGRCLVGMTVEKVEGVKYREYLNSIISNQYFNN